MACSLNDDAQSRQRRFEIIKIIYGNLTLRKTPSLTYRDITNIMKIPEHEVSAEIKVLGNAGFVGVQSITTDRIVYLKEISVRAMEQRPQPTNYDQFIERIANPQKLFGKPGKVEGPKGSFWEEHPLLKVITPIGSIVAIIAFIAWLIVTFVI